MSDSKPTMGSVAGEISGIMSGIFSSARSALTIGPTTSVDAKQEAAFYRETLERILRQSTRAEAVWREYMDSE